VKMFLAKILLSSILQWIMHQVIYKLKFQITRESVFEVTAFW
jgi:hypothetical protein